MGIFSDNISLKSGKMTCGGGRRREWEADTGSSEITGQPRLMATRKFLTISFQGFMIMFPA
jgi:hypothetical protein